ncbi:MAG: hypothetical protein WAK17_16220 [Candidatus Nitrosopolaris sp.]|jgi:hypothetical protein
MTKTEMGTRDISDNWPQTSAGKGGINSSDHDASQGLVGDILKIIEKNPKISFRSILLLQQEYGAQEVWDCLKFLRENRAIEMTKISNKKVGYKMQTWYR